MVRHLTRTSHVPQGKEARKIIVESADPKVGLPVSTGRRVNAASAVLQATAKLSGVAGEWAGWGCEGKW